MAIKVVLPDAFAPLELGDVLTALAFGGVISGVTATQVNGNVIYGSVIASFQYLGSGFTVALAPNGFPFVATGVIDSIVFTRGSDRLEFLNADIDITEIGAGIEQENTGADLLAFETFLLSQDWDLTLRNVADLANRSQTVGDGAPFNLMGDDKIRALGGHDDLFSGDGNDQVWGDRGNDTLDGGVGNDRLWGGKGADTLLGGAGGDRLWGGGGNDVIRGGAGRDKIDPGKGGDSCTGGGGADTFIFGNKYGETRITDFAAKNNREDVDLSAVSAIRNFQDLKANHMTQVGDDVVIDDAGRTKIILLEVSLGDLDARDFLF